MCFHSHTRISILLFSSPPSLSSPSYSYSSTSSSSFSFSLSPPLPPPPPPPPPPHLPPSLPPSLPPPLQSEEWPLNWFCEEMFRNLINPSWEVKYSAVFNITHLHLHIILVILMHIAVRCFVDMFRCVMEQPLH